MPPLGTPLAELDTPTLLLDLDALDANVAGMAAYFAGRSSRLRPHFKSHKCTRLALRQLAAGAEGITCAKLGEAEVLLEAGVQDVLVANQVVGAAKMRRLTALAAEAQITVAVDDPYQVGELSAAAHAAGVEIGVLVEVDLGMRRCGVPPGAPALDLARVVAAARGVRFRGLQGYEGHTVLLRDLAERRRLTEEALHDLVMTRRMIESAGLPVEIVSGGGTGTYDLTADWPGVDEVQAGSYATMDWYYHDTRPEFRMALTVLATVISRPRPEAAVLDVGLKGVGAEFGPPRVAGLPGAQVPSFRSEEHTVVQLAAPPGTDAPTAEAMPAAPRIGDKLQLIPSHGCTTCHLYREMIVHRAGQVVEVWPLEGAGRLA